LNVGLTREEPTLPHDANSAPIVSSPGRTGSSRYGPRKASLTGLKAVFLRKGFGAALRQYALTDADEVR
jgi:hypothetical protein